MRRRIGVMSNGENGKHKLCGTRFSVIRKKQILIHFNNWQYVLSIVQGEINY